MWEQGWTEVWSTTPQGQRPLHATWVLLTGQLCLLLRGQVGNTAIWFRMGMSCSLYLLFSDLVSLPPW